MLIQLSKWLYHAHVNKDHHIGYQTHACSVDRRPEPWSYKRKKRGKKESRDVITNNGYYFNFYQHVCDFINMEELERSIQRKDKRVQVVLLKSKLESRQISKH